MTSRGPFQPKSRSESANYPLEYTIYQVNPVIYMFGDKKKKKVYYFNSLWHLTVFLGH